MSTTVTSAGYWADRTTDVDRRRPIHIDYWHPSRAGSLEAPTGYHFGVGRVAHHAPLATGRHPLVMLSHGSMGSASNYSWIAEHLARSGFVVVGVSHYHESPLYGVETLDIAAATRLWERPLDVSRALDHVLAEPFFAEALSDRVGIIGHSAHAGHYAREITGARSVELSDGEGHFVFLDVTNLPIDAMGIRLGQDRPGIDRHAVHARLQSTITRFLKDAHS